VVRGERLDRFKFRCEELRERICRPPLDGEAGARGRTIGRERCDDRETAWLQETCQAFSVAGLLDRFDEKVKHRAVVPDCEALWWVEFENVIDDGRQASCLVPAGG
jgi:hypothetical protein